MGESVVAQQKRDQLSQRLINVFTGNRTPEVHQLIQDIQKSLDEKRAEEWLPHIWHDKDFKACVEACNTLLTQKGADYTGGKNLLSDDRSRLINFYESAEFFGLTPLQSLGNYWYKHLTAIFSFIKRGKVESEPIEGRIHDCINYLILMYKMVAYMKRQNVPQPVAEHNIVEERRASDRPFIDTSVGTEARR